MDRLMNVLTLLSVILIVMVLISVRRAHIRVEYSVSWLVAGTVLLFLSRSPNLLMALAGWMGIQDPPVAMLLIIFSVFLVVFYRLSIRISALKDANVALTQRLAILEYHLKVQDERQEKPVKK